MPNFRNFKVKNLYIKKKRRRRHFISKNLFCDDKKTSHFKSKNQRVEKSKKSKNKKKVLFYLAYLFDKKTLITLKCFKLNFDFNFKSTSNQTRPKIESIVNINKYSWFGCSLKTQNSLFCSCVCLITICLQS